MRSLSLTEGQRVDFLFLLVERLDLIEEEIRFEVVEFVGRAGFAVAKSERTIEISGAEDFKGVCVSIPGEFSSITFQEENMQTHCRITHI